MEDLIDEADFMAQAEIAVSLDNETALKEHERRTSLGQRALTMTVSLNEESPARRLWVATRWKTPSDFEVGPYFFSHEASDPVRFLAVWRPAPGGARVSSGDRVQL